MKDWTHYCEQPPFLCGYRVHWSHPGVLWFLPEVNNQFCLNPSMWLILHYLYIRIDNLPLVNPTWPGNMLPWEDLHGENQDGESGPGEDWGQETDSWSSVIPVKSWGRGWWISNAGVSEELRLEDVATSTVSCEHGAVQVVLAVICLVVQGN